MENNIVINNENNLAEIENNFENYTFIEVASKIYAIKTKNVLLIEKIMEFDYASNLPNCILGFINYDNKPIGVIDLREIFKEKRIVYDINAKLIIVKREDTVSAFVCDNIVDIKRLLKEKIHSLPFKDENSFWEGVYSENDKSVYIIDTKKIVDYINNNTDKFQKENEEGKYLPTDDKSKKILKERKEALSKAGSDIQFIPALYDMGVSFQINGVKYYINLASVKEFYKVNNSKFIKVPNTPEYIFGLINIKGEYITVIDIRNFYTNTKTEIKEKSTIIILNSNEYKIGILADEILESMNINFDKLIQNKIQQPTETILNEFVKDNEIYQVVDVEKLLKDDRLTIC